MRFCREKVPFRIEIFRVYTDSTPKSSDAKTETKDTNDVLSGTNTANLKEIIVSKDIVPTINEDLQDSEKRKTLYVHSSLNRLLCKFTVKGDWTKAESKLKRDKELATKAISSDGSTMLHIAVGIGHNDFVKKLLSYINDEQVLKQRDPDGSTALHIAAIVGNKHAAELLVKKSNKLLAIKDQNGDEPLHKAYVNMHLDTIGFLLKAVRDGGKPSQSSLAGSVHPDDEIGVRLLVNAISARQYTLNKSWRELGEAAWDALKLFGLLAITLFGATTIRDFTINLIAVFFCTVPWMVFNAIVFLLLLILVVCFIFELLHYLGWNIAKILCKS
ncbi:hypothetical protein L1987_64837 [Smallanthus sonchifolius]|uniref:Uncharacterized protein n=1 Tax=Smallanthus sonchifolius TaxID=185202 RepID=A0ACB9BT22_9ASTR|nr:hypothetical protein L1987_64837 [Smallanthus sonchifolius]